MVKKIKPKYNKPFLDKAYEPSSRPNDYPTPEVDDLLFFIQRNYNTDAVIYQINYGQGGVLNLNDPMKVSWMKFHGDNTLLPLNYMQRKLAYGFNHDVISNELIEFEFVSYPKRFFLAKHDGRFQVYTDILGENAIIKLAYVYADEAGVFPDVKFIELYGHDIKTGKEVYERLNID